MVFRHPVASATAREATWAPNPIDTQPINPWGAFCQLYVVALASVCMLTASQVRRFLPERFLLDGLYIEQTLRVPDGALDPDDPFRNIALVYRARAQSKDGSLVLVAELTPTAVP